MFLQLLKGEKVNNELFEVDAKTKYALKSMDDDWDDDFDVHDDEPSNEKDADLHGVALMSLVGPVMKYDYCFTPGTKTMAEQIQQIDANPKLKGTVLYIDSPGGEALAMELLHNAILRAEKPVIAVVEGMCCSAAMGIASACDQIFAAGDSCIIGSIGTMISFTDITGWKEFEGINFHEIYATKSVDKNKDFRDALKNNYSTIRTNMLDPLNEFFINMVSNALPEVNKAESFTGKTFLTTKAIENGLVTNRGDIKTAINTIMLGMEFKKLSQFKGKQLSETQMSEVEKILAKAGVNVKLQRQAVVKSLTYVTSEDKTIYVYAEEGEDPVGKRCVWADDAGKPTEEPIPQGDHELKDGSVMSVSINEDDGFSYVDEIVEGEATTDEQPSEKKGGDKEETPEEEVKSKVNAAMKIAGKGMSAADRKKLASEIAEQILNSSDFGKSPDAEVNGNASDAKGNIFKEGAFAKRQREIQENYKKGK